MEFAFTARDSLGHAHDGTIAADSQDAAMQSLRRDGLQVLSLEEDDDSLRLFPRRVTRGEIIYMTSQLAIMVDTGINLAQALAGMQEQEDNPTLKRVLGELRGAVEAGEDFSSALAQHPKCFDRTFVALVKSSEQTGSMGETLEQIAHYLRKELEQFGKVRSALAYPAIMLVLSLAVTIFLLTFVMPKFTPLFERRGVKLPMITEFVIGLSGALLDYWYVWVALALTLGVGFVFARGSELARKVLDGFCINAPIIGPMYRKVILGRGIRTLGAMLENGVAVLEALSLTAEVSGNYYYEKIWLHVVDEVTNGSRVCEALAGNPLLPKTLIQMISSGEETGRLGYVLKKVSGYYDNEVETALKTATSMIEPLLMSVMGVVVGGIGLSLMLPIFTLSRSH